MLTISESDNAIYDFSKKAVENGLDIFRVFDSLNYIGKSKSHVACIVISRLIPSTENVCQCSHMRHGSMTHNLYR